MHTHHVQAHSKLSSLPFYSESKKDSLNCTQNKKKWEVPRTFLRIFRTVIHRFLIIRVNLGRASPYKYIVAYFDV